MVQSIWFLRTWGRNITTNAEKTFIQDQNWKRPQNMFLLTPFAMSVGKMASYHYILKELQQNVKDSTSCN